MTTDCVCPVDNGGIYSEHVEDFVFSDILPIVETVTEIPTPGKSPALEPAKHSQGTCGDVEKAESFLSGMSS